MEFTGAHIQLQSTLASAKAEMEAAAKAAREEARKKTSKPSSSTSPTTPATPAATPVPREPEAPSLFAPEAQPETAAEEEEEEEGRTSARLSPPSPFGDGAPQAQECKRPRRLPCLLSLPCPSKLCMCLASITNTTRPRATAAEMQPKTLLRTPLAGYRVRWGFQPLSPLPQRHWLLTRTRVYISHESPDVHPRHNIEHRRNTENDDGRSRHRAITCVMAI